ncbi:histidinol dehydrogenase [Methanoculleus bourgensis MS2]|uniref:Histidinol dehydrogenase n=1 Tax=Methanoculleus bourgensis (strain ATCC 43281 / DSM 3045 / OCM 15 / MS2) TaxID=1201294 RepID=I7KBH1_METBM|nr:histidinol dehydrogenase [Methanoculleus bourgensis]CCJ35426.1 histidinol dehydrogenase [Methanoculleus bourgensis MS2]
MWKALDIETWIAGRRSDLDRVKGSVSEIIGRVRAEGDDALVDLTKKFDGIDLAEIAVSDEEREAAYDQVDAELVESLVQAEVRISRFHELQRGRDLWLQEMEPGITLGVKTTPLSRVGAYVPGGRAAYPSTALMCTIPAVVAGVREICCCTPPPINPITLVALDIAGVDEIYRVGGAQAIAAMAIGTETIPGVEKIVGPGNVFVTAAKMLLRDEVEIDFPAGPSEIAVLADSTANPRFIAADILAQAEHDPSAACVLVTTDAALADAVGAEVKRMVEGADRREIIEKALDHSGYIVAGDLDEAVATVNGIAPEHLSVQVADPLGILTRFRSAGSIFVGPYAAVACGDYASGTNHVLPTAGYARLYSGLDVNHFCRRSTVQMITREGLEAIGDVVETIADAEGLHAHAESVRVRRRR